MRQTFIIETEKRLTSKELFGCLEDTLGENNEVWRVSRINPNKTTKRQLIENVSISKAKRQENKNVCEVEK
jgi:hypothetical protein